MRAPQARSGEPGGVRAGTLRLLAVGSVAFALGVFCSHLGALEQPPLVPDAGVQRQNALAKGEDWAWQKWHYCPLNGSPTTRATFDGLEFPACTRPASFTAPRRVEILWSARTPRPATTVFVVQRSDVSGGRHKNVSILMGVRRFAPNVGKLDFPGGFVLPREDVAHAAAREVREEFGVTVSPDECSLLDCLHELYGPTSGIPVFNCGLVCIVAPPQRPSTARSGARSGVIIAAMNSDLAPLGAEGEMPETCTLTTTTRFLVVPLTYISCANPLSSGTPRGNTVTVRLAPPNALFAVFLRSLRHRTARWERWPRRRFGPRRHEPVGERALDQAC